MACKTVCKLSGADPLEYGRLERCGGAVGGIGTETSHATNSRFDAVAPRLRCLAIEGLFTLRTAQTTSRRTRRLHAV